MLKMPVLAKCSDRSVRAKTNSITGSPPDWLNSRVLSSYGYLSTSFDFFVNWSKRIVANELWQKRVVVNHYEPWPQLDPQILLSSIQELETKEGFQTLVQFCQQYGFECSYLLFKDETNWRSNPSSIVEIKLSQQNSSIDLRNVKDLMIRIRNLRGGQVPIGPGGLIYGTTSLECFLSTTPDFWPGDVDCLLLNSKGNPVAILEYKKHTLNTRIDDQTVMTYRDRDKLKYQSLGLLRNSLDPSGKLPIVMLFYPTQYNSKYVKFEKLSGSFNSLTPVSSTLALLPTAANKESHLELVRKLNELLLQ